MTNKFKFVFIKRFCSESLRFEVLTICVLLYSTFFYICVGNLLLSIIAASILVSIQYLMQWYIIK